MFIILLIAIAYGHGRLTTPATRTGGLRIDQLNAPTGTSGNGGNNNDAWVCRVEGKTAADTVLQAGTTTSLQWSFSAAHVGDCDVYLSYDVTAARKDMTWFKIANFFDCRSQNNQKMAMKLPSWLPKGQAVMRFGWYALHQHPNVEFYSNCVDVSITGTATALPNGVKTYKLGGLFPLTANQGVGYSNRFNPGNKFMTGPACANGYTENSCALTAPGQTGYIAVAGGAGPPVITQTTTKPGTQAPSNPRNQRCGTSWIEANTKCGTACPGNTDNECTTAGEKCYSDLNSCENKVPTTTLAVCTSGKWVAKRNNLPANWCQDTCTNEALRSKYCDTDTCSCEGGLPTTAKPTTAKPTTAKPTTEKPTTAKPTMPEPTTAKPTMPEPITPEPNRVGLGALVDSGASETVWFLAGLFMLVVAF